MDKRNLRRLLLANPGDARGYFLFSSPENREETQGLTLQEIIEYGSTNLDTIISYETLSATLKELLQEGLFRINYSSIPTNGNMNALRWVPVFYDFDAPTTIAATSILEPPLTLPLPSLQTTRLTISSQSSNSDLNRRITDTPGHSVLRLDWEDRILLRSANPYCSPQDEFQHTAQPLPFFAKRINASDIEAKRHLDYLIVTGYIIQPVRLKAHLKIPHYEITEKAQNLLTDASCTEHDSFDVVRLLTANPSTVPRNFEWLQRRLCIPEVRAVNAVQIAIIDKLPIEMKVKASA